jgi:predicted NBD/HSP70 family sugar kinase
MLNLKSVDQEIIKDANKKMIINLLRSQGELTKQQIAKNIGVSIPTVISNINELLQEGIVEEAGVGDSSGGRKPVIVRFKPNSRYSFGIELGLYCIKIILTNLDSEIIEEVVLDVDLLSEAKTEKDINEFFDKISVIVNNMMQSKAILKASVLGIGIALPGTVNEEKMILEWAPNLAIKNIDFGILSKKTDMKIYLENEANAAALAELRLGVAKDMKNLVYISITEGMGTGIVVQDYLYKGKNKRAGEFGHMTIVKDGRLCKCGKRGCWEQYASELALLNEYNTNSVDKLTNISEFFKKLQAGNEICKSIWDEYLEYLAIGIQNIILILDPHYIIIGGRISNYENLIIEALKEKVFTKNSFFGPENIKIFASKLKSYSAIMGVSLLPMQKLFFLNDKIL